VSEDRLRELRERWTERDAREPQSAAPKARSAGAKRRSPPPPPAPTATEPVDGGGSLRRLSTPRPISIRTGDRGVPTGVGPLPVEAVLEDWVVEDRWWTGKPVRRRYFELVLVNGRNVVVFKDLVGGCWFAQRA
jgi:hypothetical protein